MKRVIMFAVISALTLLLGMQVNAAGEDDQEQRIPATANLWIGDYQIISEGKLTGEMPDNVSYNEEENVLTLNNFCLEDSIRGIYASLMGDNFTIRLEGENTLNVHTTAEGNPISSGIVASIESGSNLTIEGPGTLNLPDISFFGINSEGLTIDGCTINMTGDPMVEGHFYGICGALNMETETLIKDSRININNTMASGTRDANAGIDVQDGNLTVQNSEIDIQLENGNIFGLAAGQTEEYGGRITIDDSTIKCITSTDMSNANHNMYFYEMTNAEDLYYYVQDGDSFIQKTFDEAFELNKYLPERYDTNYGSTVISSVPLKEYCSHNWDAGKETTEPSCENAGKMTYTCTICGETKTEEIAALGHIWGDWQTIKEAACTEDGSRMRTCSRCNETETEAITQLGHDFVTDVIKEPTCTEPGLQNKTCSRCDLVIENETIPEIGHDYEWVVEKEATFHEDGVRKGTCSNCGDIVTERIPKLSESHEHDFTGREEVTKPATCTEEGSKNIYCTEPECGEYITEIIPVTAHTLGAWTTVKRATCSENGVEKRACTVCGVVVETRVTDKLPHTYEEWTITVDPTCTEAGVETAVCAACGETAVRGVNPLGHDYVEWEITKEPTCTEDGVESSVCTRCGENGTRVIEAAGHSFGDWIIVKEATLTSEGERQAICSICGQVKSGVIPKLSTLRSNTTGQENPVDQNVAPGTGDGNDILLYVILLATAAGIIAMIGRKRILKM